MRCFPQNPEALLSVRRPSSRRFNPKSLILLIALNLSLIIQKVRTVYFSDIGLSLRLSLVPSARLSLLSSLAPSLRSSLGLSLLSSLTPSSWPSLVKFILIYVLTFLTPLNLASNSAYANNLPIAVDGSTNTQIDTAANGVPIVNIAAPNSGGLSHNKFRDYNVNPSGLVINNATNNPNQVIQTNLAGLIVDNPNLANVASARVILNEVTSANRSILNGYTEIGGRQADLIIANPNGITMNSAGFINVSRLTAIVGSSNQFNPNPSDLSFNLSGNRNLSNGFLPKLTISGLGLDVTKVTETDLISNIMEIVSPIYGGDNRVNFRAGDKEFNYNTKEVTSDNTNPGSNQPDEIAIDASNLAKVQAGQIYMIATKEGFGVKYNGDMLASRAGITIDAKGNIVYNNALSKGGNIEVKTTNGDITTTGITHNKDINSDVKLEASNDVNNQGQLLSVTDINVTAGNILNNTKEIIAGNNITILSNQITNDKDAIIAGNKLNITANNNINNYGTLSAKAILSLKSINGNINNYDGAELIASNQNNPESSQLILEAINGAINQYSPNSVVVNGDHAITANDYTNTGRIDIAGSLIMNIANNLINDIGALIYAGNDMYLNVVNDLTNRENATIYAQNNLTIRKYDPSHPDYDVSNNRINKLTNISGNIETYAGNISIKADIFSNIRNVDPVSNLVSTNANCNANGSSIICNSAINSDYATNHNLYSWSRFNGWDWGEFGYNTQYKTTQGSINSSSKSAVISSGGNLDIDSNTFNNHISKIYSVGDMSISANNTSNFNTSFTYGKDAVWTAIYDGIGHWPSWCGGSKPCRRNEYSFSNFQTYLSYIKSGGLLTITQDGSTNASLINGSNVDNYASLDGTEGRDLNSVNGIDMSNLNQTGVLDIDLSNYLNGPDNQGMFQKSTNPNAPLFETRSQFIDQSKFFGSDYFYQKIGLNLTDVQTEFEQQNKRLVGDEFFQNKIIEEQLRTIKKNSLLLSNSNVDSGAEIKNLLDNAADEYARLGLSANETLTQSQIDSLQKDIVWFETQTIDGQQYITPKIYLTKATRDSLNNNNKFATKSTIMAMGEMQLDSNSLINSGSIVGNNITISTTNDITNNNFSDITATNNLNLTSNSGSIINFSKLKAAGAVSLTAQNNITNTATVKTNASNLLNTGNPAYISSGSASANSGNISSSLIETAIIEAGSININAGNDFNNYGANITTTTGDLNILAGDDINFNTVQLRNRSEYRSKKYTKITDETKNIGSNINIGGNLVINAGKIT